MLFKNLSIFRLDQSVPPISSDELADRLWHRPFQKCSPMQSASAGFVPPRKGGALVEFIAGAQLVALKIQERLLPASVVAEEVEERVKKIEEEQGRKVGRKELRELRERVGEELLPRAYLRSKKVLAWISPGYGWFVVDSASAAVVDLVTGMIGEHVKLARYSTVQSARHAMAEWLAAGAPDGFTIDSACKLKSPEEATIAYSHFPVADSDEIRNHIATGKLPASMELTWHDKLTFQLTGGGVVKRLAFLDALIEESRDESADPFDADMTIMTGMLNEFLADLTAALGGMAVQEGGAE